MSDKSAALALVEDDQELQDDELLGAEDFEDVDFTDAPELSKEAETLFEGYVVRSEDAEKGRWFPFPGISAEIGAEIFIRPSSNEDFEKAAAAIYENLAGSDGKLGRNVYRALMPALFAENIATSWRNVPGLRPGEENTGTIAQRGCRVWVMDKDKNGQPVAKQIVRNVSFSIDESGFLKNTKQNRRRAFLVMGLHVPVGQIADDPLRFNLPVAEDVEKNLPAGSTG